MKVPATLTQRGQSTDGIKQSGRQQQGSQLTTPPDSGTRVKGRVGSSTPRAKVKQDFLFQDLFVTKPSSTNVKESPNVPHDSQQVGYYQGFTTTEDAVKSTHNGLAKTTLEKLAAFRYNPAAKDIILSHPPKSIHAAPGTILLPNQEPENISDNHFTNHDLLPTSESFLNQAMWYNKSGVDSVRSHLGYCDPTAIVPSCEESPVYGTLAQHRETENEGLGVGAAHINHIDRQPHPHALNLSQFEDNFGTYEFLNLSQFIEPIAVRNVAPDAGIDQEEPDFPRINHSETFGKSPVKTEPKYQIEVERSSMDDYEPTPQTTKDLFASDDFDEGLDDEDLLAIAPEVIPQTPARATPRDQALVTTKHLQRNPTKENLVSPAISLEHHDEFPIDEEEEEELLKLPEISQNFEERFIPPESVQEVFDVEPGNREVFDCSLQFSPPRSEQTTQSPNKAIAVLSSNEAKPRVSPGPMEPPPAIEAEDWSFIRSAPTMPDPFVDSPRPTLKYHDVGEGKSSSLARRSGTVNSKAQTCATPLTSRSVLSFLDDSHEYEPLKPFARSEFPPLLTDRCPVLGMSAQMFLRTCFRIGEMYQAGAKCSALRLDGIIELFARVNFSSREAGTTKQHFQFLDLWHDRPPFTNGILDNFKMTGLAESESRVFLTSGGKKMARVLGRPKRDVKNQSWWLQVINIRETDWEEIKWTRRIVSGDDFAKKEKEKGFALEIL